jgi:hypothetical protein
MPERCCHYCQQVFEASIYHPQQRVCSQPECQRRRKAEYHRNKIRQDAAYAETVRNSQSGWRAEHPDYWKQYRKRRPEVVERNREQQRRRDRQRQLENLAKNNLALDLKSMACEVWFVGPAVADLAKNNLASAKVFICQPFDGQTGAGGGSCKEQPYRSVAGAGL